MKLIDLCDPLFRYVSSLKRALKRGAAPGESKVRSEVLKLLGRIRDSADDPDLEVQFDAVELALIFFVDFIVLESGTQLADDWEPIAYDRNELTGDQKFFEMLEQTLADPSDEASERLAIYHTCLALGFTGGQEEAPVDGHAYLSFAGAGTSEMDKTRRKVYSRVRKFMGIKAGERLVPEAYEHVDRSKPAEDTGRKLLVMAITLAVLTGVLVIANFFLFSSTSTAIFTVLDRIQERSGSPVSDARAEP
ncbi:MAG: DotU family type IV/VI secretion system protein [Planctomycetota bacterium]|jgi:type IV/VI secretion system ImpK/VasF family protein